MPSLLRRTALIKKWIDPILDSSYIIPPTPPQHVQYRYFTAFPIFRNASYLFYTPIVHYITANGLATTSNYRENRSVWHAITVLMVY